MAAPPFAALRAPLARALRCACALFAAVALLACGSGAPPRAVAIASAVERPACDPRVARWQLLPTRGAARGSFERGESELFVGSLCEFLRSARHGGRTPRVLAAARAPQGLRLVARPPLERAVELKGRAIGLDPDQDGLLLLARVLRDERLELDDVRLEWRDASALADALESGEFGAIAVASDAAADAAAAFASGGWTVLVGSAELERERARDVARALDALAPLPLEPAELAELQRALDELEQALVEVGELIGPTGGADALRAPDVRVRQLGA
ncbi:MAG: hypothetical protein EPO68_14420 [Planctomycetota bacterium]|nr:MAG: hypothetical protein EPO68_14420 [Planctomycetota bacterium]